jgi:hypothetical protein
VQGAQVQVASLGQSLVRSTINLVPGAYYGGLASQQLKAGNYGTAAIYEVVALADAFLGIMTLGTSSLETGAVRTVTTQVEQYALKATEEGFYPVMTRGFKQPQAGIRLNPGDVWKFGTTQNPATRYSQSFLTNWGLVYEKQFTGTLDQALSAERSNILNYLNQFGTLPPGNKIIR